MLKTLGAQIKEFKKDSFLTPVFMILEVLMETVIPLMMASIIDNGVEKGDIHHIYVMGGLMIVTACVSLFAGVMGGKYGARASTGFARNLRKAMYENIQTFSFSNIDKFSTAGLVTRLTTDVTNIQMAYQMILRMCVRAPITLVCAMIMAFFINAKLACIYLAAVILLGIILAFITVRAHKYFTQVFPKYDDLNASVQENVSAIRVVKAYVREDCEKDRFKKASENIYKMFVKAEGVTVFNNPVMMAAVYTCIILISWFGAKMIVVKSLTTGELMSLLAYCMNILMSLMMLSMVFVMISMSMASMRRIAEVLDETSDIHNPEHPLYNVNDVFNAIFVHGNVLGDAMFYGSGAGKLPTASAVVADVVDEAKHLNRNIMTMWKEEKLQLEDKADSKRRFFVRIKGKEEELVPQLKESYGEIEVVKVPELEGEFGFVTPVMMEGDYETRSKLYKEQIVHMIRIQD